MRFAKISEFSISKFLLVHEFPAPRNAFDSIFKFSNCRVKNLKTFNRHLEPPSRKFFFHEKFPLYSLYFPPPTATIHNLTVSHRRPANSYHLSGPLNRSYQQRSTTKFVVKRRNESGRKANTPPLPALLTRVSRYFCPTSAIRSGGRRGERDTVKRIENWKIVSFLINESRRGRERESKAWPATDEGTRDGAAIVQAVIAPRPAVPTIQWPPLLHCRVLAKRSPRISRLNCTFLKTMPTLIESWIVDSFVGYIADS